ncbi:MAG: rod-binding protein [Lachnospiraceae bacterium]|nr:rod-binding protein [Lachnospiraceae bacterium]
MDITSLYNQYIQDTASKQTGSAGDINLKKDYSKATDEELMAACKKFEAYFLEQCFKEMSKTVGKDEFESGSTSTLVDFYKDNLIQNIAEQSTEKESLGLAQMLYEQMKRNYNL